MPEASFRRRDTVDHEAPFGPIPFKPPTLPNLLAVHRRGPDLVARTPSVSRSLFSRRQPGLRFELGEEGRDRGALIRGRVLERSHLKGGRLANLPLTGEEMGERVEQSAVIGLQHDAAPGGGRGGREERRWDVHPFAGR